jgi:acyl-coenzyme A thioesterase PaaI-like protein
MVQAPLNTELLEKNACFGCGHSNPRGLHIEVFRDSSQPDQLMGRLRTTEDLTGFPGITHGGAIYTALDCLACWVATILRPEQQVLWVLRSAEMTYHKPAKPGQTLQLLGKIDLEAEVQRSVVVHAEARDESGDLVAEGRFREVPLTVDQFKRITGLNELPENWRAFIEGSSRD